MFCYFLYQPFISSNNNILKYSNDFPLFVYFIKNNSYSRSAMYSFFSVKIENIRFISINILSSKYSLSEVSFIHTGTEDTVQWLHCSLLLRNWKKDDDVWVEHSNENLKCLFMLLCKGSHLIENVKREYLKNNVCPCQSKL